MTNHYPNFRSAVFILPFQILVITLLVSIGGCKKFADVSPPNNQLVSATVFSSDNSALAALAGLYARMYIESGQSFQVDISQCPENSADETHYYTSEINYDPFYTNSISPASNNNYYLWSGFYNAIYLSNAIIAGTLPDNVKLSTGVRNQARGEAMFVRAFCNFYLVNFYGSVPLIKTTDAVSNNSASKAPVEEIYTQIINDLLEAQRLLREDYSTSATQSRIRPNKYAATALLARVYLYNKRWADAEAQATAVINKSPQYNLASTATMSSAFRLNNPEVIFQMNGATSGSATVYSGFTYYGSNYQYAILSGRPYMVMVPSMVQSFETGDKRLSNWVGTITYNGTTYSYPLKYRNYTSTTGTSAEGFVYLRLAEQYLIRAEARAELGNTLGAAADLNVIRNRAGLGNTTAVSQDGLRQAVFQERRVELFCEGGHRWFDLKRTGRADQVLGATKTGWKSTAAFYPIPQYDLLNNINLTQNPGY